MLAAWDIAWSVLRFIGRYKKYFAYAAVITTVSLWAHHYIERERAEAAEAAEQRVKREVMERTDRHERVITEARRQAQADTDRTADPMLELRRKWRAPRDSASAGGARDVSPD